MIQGGADVQETGHTGAECWCFWSALLSHTWWLWNHIPSESLESHVPDTASWASFQYRIKSSSCFFRIT